MTKFRVAVDSWSELELGCLLGIIFRNGSIAIVLLVFLRMTL